MARVADLVAAAKLWLISEGGAGLAYLAEGLYALVLVESTEVRTVASDERWRLYVNPTWAEQQDAPVLAREVAHQLWHLLMSHADRARAIGATHDRKAWRQAADLALCDVLGAHRVAPKELAGEAAELRARNPGRLPVGRPPEEYWATLSGMPATPVEDSADEGDRDHGSSLDGVARPWEIPPDADIGELTPAEGDLVRMAVAITYRGERGGRGDEPGEALRWAKRLTRSELPWELLLAQAVRRGVGWASGRTHQTYSRPNRRASAMPGVALPGWRRPVPRVACVVDTSGSVDDVLLGKALAEVDGALRALGVADAEVTVLACDAVVHSVQNLRRAKDAVLVGGGGTNMAAGLAEVAALRPRPSLTVVFTDGYTLWPPDPPPGCAVVVALLLRSGQTPPRTPTWATAVRCELEESAG